MQQSQHYSQSKIIRRAAATHHPQWIQVKKFTTHGLAKSTCRILTALFKIQTVNSDLTAAARVAVRSYVTKLIRTPMQNLVKNS